MEIDLGGFYDIEYEEVIEFDDSEQAIEELRCYKTDRISIKREVIDDKKEYFKRKLIGK